jgi:hypothetical protein
MEGEEAVAEEEEEEAEDVGGKGGLGMSLTEVDKFPKDEPFWA